MVFKKCAANKNRFKTNLWNSEKQADMCSLSTRWGDRWASSEATSGSPRKTCLLRGHGIGLIKQCVWATADHGIMVTGRATAGMLKAGRVT